MHPCGMEYQQHPGLHQEKCSQQGEEDDPSPLRSGVLGPVLGSSIQGTYRFLGGSPMKAHKEDLRDGSIWHTERLKGLWLLRLQKIQGDLSNVHKYLMGDDREGAARLFWVISIERTRGTILNTEIPFKYKNAFWPWECLNSKVDSILGGTQDPTGQGPKHSALADPALSRGLGTR